MTDEEKKAIEGLEWSQQQMRLGNLPDYDQGHYADIRILLNLIEKQSKEIEELNSDLEVFKRALTDIEVVYNKNYTSNDKIKAKIEVLEKLQKEFPNNDEIRIKIIAYKELLEKE